MIRSLDGGETWTSGCPLVGCAGQLIADPSGSGALMMITTFSLYLSRDWGLTFNHIGPPGTNNLGAAAMVPSHPGWIYAAGEDPDQPNVLVAPSIDSLYKSTDSAVSWTLQGRFIGAAGPGRQAPFALVRHKCNPAGGLFALVSGATETRLRSAQMTE